MSAYLRVRNLLVALKSGERLIRSVSLDAAAGEVLRLVSESGAGKSMSAR